MNTLKKDLQILFLLIALLCFCLPQSVSAQAEISKWTVFLYLCGANLESEDGQASGNLQSLLNAPGSEDINFVIQTGGANKWEMEGIDVDKTDRFLIQGDSMTKIDTLPLQDMGRPETLGAFLSWGVQAYPAEKYMVVLWDHGGGPLSGAIWDELHDDNHMTVPELAQAVSQAGVKFELIGFDACLMGSIEIASMMAPYGNYYIASEEIEPGAGWNYEQLATYLVNNPDTDGVYLGKLICDTFKWASDSSVLLPNSHTLSVVDLAKIAPLSKALGELILEWGDLLPSIQDYQALIQDLSGTEKYVDGSTMDIGDMVMRAETLDPLASQKVRIAINDAVVYSVHGSSRNDSYGISFVYDQTLDSDTLDEYAKVCPMPEYLAYLDSVHADWKAPDWVYEQTARVQEPDEAVYQVAFDTYENDEGLWELKLTHGKDAVQMITYSLAIVGEEHDDPILLGESAEVAADWDNGVFVSGFDGTWPAIGDEFCYMEQIYDQGEYALFDIPVMIEDEQMNLRAAYWYENDYQYAHFEFFGLGSEVGSSNDVPNRDVTPLDDETTFSPVYYVITDEDIEIEEGDEVNYSEGVTTLQPETLPDDDYAIIFNVTDVLGVVHTSDPLLITIQDGSFL